MTAVLGVSEWLQPGHDKERLFRLLELSFVAAIATTSLAPGRASGVALEPSQRPSVNSRRARGCPARRGDK